MLYSHSNHDTAYFVMNSAKIHSLFRTLLQVSLAQFVSRLSFIREFVSSILTRYHIFFINKYFGPIILKFVTDI